MILKIEGYPGPKIGPYQNWWLLDDIRKVSKIEFQHPFSQDFNDDEADIFILNYENFLISIGASQDSRKVIRLVCRLSNGNEFSVLFDTVAYLLNDEGKTIEKIVANYRQ